MHGSSHSSDSHSTATVIEETGHSILSACSWRGQAAVAKKAKQQQHQLAEQTVARWRNEVNLLSRIKEHKHITQIFDSDASSLTILLRQEQGRSLDRIIDAQQFSTFGRVECQILLRGMVSALAHLHGLGIVHDDVKADNIMWSTSEGENGGRPVLIDFGAAFDEQAVGLDYFVPSGTPSWTPPEFLDRRKGKAGDVWSLGVVMLFAMRYVALPDGEWILPHALEGGKPKEEMKKWLDEVDCLRVRVERDHPVIARMLTADPEARISSEQLGLIMDEI